MERKKANLKIVLFMCFTVIPMIIFGISWSYLYEKNTLKMTNKIMSNKLYSNGDGIKKYLDEIDGYIEETISNVEDKKDSNTVFKKVNEELFKNDETIINTFLTDTEGKIISEHHDNNTKIKEIAKREDFKKNDQYLLCLDEEENNNFSVILYKPMYVNDKYNGCIGIVLDKREVDKYISNMNLFENQLNLLINSNTKDVFIYEDNEYRFDNDNNILNLEEYICKNIYDDEVLSFSKKDNNEEYNVYAYKMKDENFIFVTIINNKELINEGEFKVKLILLMIITILILCLGVYLLYKKFYNRPVDKIVNTINRINKGDLSARCTESDEKDIDKIGTAINILADKLEQEKTANEKISYIDSLTKIDNRTKFLMDGTSILFSDEKENYSLIKFDIDKFKYINDIHGYDFGDKIIKHIADVLKLCMTYDDSYYARGTDDSFCMLLKETDDEKIVDFINSFVKQFDSLKDERGRALKINFSFGIYKLEDSDDDFEKLIDKANIAQESAKLIANHRSTYDFYDYEMKQTALKERKIENIMYDALENKEFAIYLQAKNDLNTLTIVGAEALVRWNSKEFGFISPGDFIPIFEKNGFVTEVDFYVFEEVCKSVRSWLDNNIEPVVISVNQSKRHLEHDDYIDRLEKIIKKYKVPAKYIELEITEATVLHNIEKLIQVIDELHKIGFKISIDDFGSGYSSLNLLKEINADILKIDREFLKEVEDSTKSKTIIRHVIEMAKELNIKTITEGVEKEEQAEFLRNMGCDMAQGFLYARPIAIPEFEEKYIKSRAQKVKDKRQVKKEKRKKQREQKRKNNKRS